MALELGEVRRAELVEARVRQLHLRLDAGDLQDAEARGLARAVPQERRLPHPRLTADAQDRALARSDVSQQPVQHLALADPAPERRQSPPGHSAMRA